MRFNGELYASRRGGATAVNAQAEPVDRAAVRIEPTEIVADALA